MTAKEWEGRVAAAVAQEREACARLAKEIGAATPVGAGAGDCAQGCQGIADEIAAAIRARGRDAP
jgi:hypothetical protein